MPSSAVQIANRALTKLGDARILSLTEDSNGARVLNSMFEAVRDAELRRHRWKFALARAELLADADAPAFGFSYAYELPADFLGLVQVSEYVLRPYTPERGPWQREGTKILTDLPAPLRIRYIKRVENPGLFDPLFCEAFACRLAFESCESLTQSSTKKQAAREDYAEAVQEAMRCDAIEATADLLPQGSWLDSREGPFYGGAARDDATGYSGFSVG